MNSAFLYILKHYIKNFFIILFGLVFIITLIDYVQYINSINGVNRAFLYFYYTFNYIMLTIYPIAMVFAAIMTLTSMLFKNHLLILSSFGYSKRAIAKPITIGAFSIYLLFLILNTTDFAYSGDRAYSIIKGNNVYKSVKNIFLKYNDSFVSAKNMDIIKKELKDATLYKIKNHKIEYLLEFKKAKFKNGEWIVKDGTKKSFVYKNGEPNGYITQKVNYIKILKGYYPKVVKLLYEGKRMSLQDGLAARALLKNQNIDSAKITAALCERIIMPLFAPFLIAITVMLTPIHVRFFSKAKYFLYTIGATLIIWSLMYSLNMISVNGVISPLLAQPLLVLILAIISTYVYIKRIDKI